MSARSGREHRWRTLRVGHEVEPRPSRADEALLTADARERDARRRADERRQLDQDLAVMAAQFERMELRVARLVVGDSRSDLRAVRNGIRRLRRRLADD